RSGKLLESIDLERSVPHNYILGLDIDGNDVWVATSKGLGWAVGNGYYPGVRRRVSSGAGQPKMQAVADAADVARKAAPTLRPLSSPHGALSAEALGVLQAIDGLSPYELPNLKLKTDAKYAHIDKDLAPFH